MQNSTSATDEIWDKLGSNPKPMQHAEIKRYATLNNHGFSDFASVAASNNWLMESVLKYSKHVKLPILDIAGGFGGLTKQMLENGATVLLNDMEMQHLIVARNSIDKKYYPKLFLKQAKFPNELDFEPNSFSAICLIRVLLFLSPEQIENGLRKVHNWLAPNGKVFALSAAPQKKEYGELTMKKYEERWKAGDLWPGYGFKSKDIISKDRQDKFPESIHLLDFRPIEKVLSKIGFIVERQGLFENDERNPNGNIEFGFIAIKG